MKRNRRAGVEDRWTKTIRDEHGNEKKVPSARNGKGKRWMARYVDDEGHERAKAFDREVDAQLWLDSEVTAKLATGTYVAPRAGLITVGGDVRIVVGIAGPHLPQDGHIAAQLLAHPCPPAVGRRVCGRRENIGGEDVGREDGGRRGRRADDQPFIRVAASGARRRG